MQIGCRDEEVEGPVWVANPLYNMHTLSGGCQQPGVCQLGIHLKSLSDALNARVERDVRLQHCC